MLDVLDALGSFSGAFIALILAIEFFHARGKTRDEARRAQAELVTMTAQTQQTEVSPNQFEVHGCTLTIFNESSQVIHLQGVTLIRDIGWDMVRSAGDLDVPRHTIGLSRRVLRPQEDAGVELPSGWTIDIGVGGLFAVVEFVDARGRVWRRRSDTFELRPLVAELSRPQEWFQAITQRSRVLRWLLQDLPIRRAQQVAGRDVSMRRSRLSARWVRATHGYWPAGEEDPWNRPNGAPAAWGFDGLFPPPSSRP
jgi:hypothetical protein